MLNVKSDLNNCFLEQTYSYRKQDNSASACSPPPAPSLSSRSSVVSLSQRTSKHWHTLWKITLHSSPCKSLSSDKYRTCAFTSTVPNRIVSPLQNYPPYLSLFSIQTPSNCKYFVLTTVFLESCITGITQQQVLKAPIALL